MKRQAPRLHLIGPLDVPVTDYADIALRAVQGGCDALHVRVPGGKTDEFLGLARHLSRECDAAVIVNDRLDIAQLAAADGVQLGEHSVSVADARRLLGENVLVGRSIHDLAGAMQAQRDGADFVLAGHVFDTPSKDGVPGRGVEWLAGICAEVRIPVVALGGVTIERIPIVLSAGAWGVAMGREILLAADPEAAARKSQSAIIRAGRSSGVASSDS